MNQGFVYRDTISEKQGGHSALDYLTRHYPHTSSTDWEARFAAGEIRVDSRPAAPEQTVLAGQELAWHRPPWEEPSAPLDFAVLARDAHYLAVAKPSGLPTLPGGGFLEHTLLSLVRARVPEATPLHRLGRGTSGVLVFALTGRGREHGTQAFRRGQVKKTYRCLATGTPDHHAWTQDTGIGPVPHAPLGTVMAASPAGKPARSHVRVLREHPDNFLAEVQIETGRAHQIRIHLAASGHPLVGDPLYGAGGLPLPGTQALPGDLGYLLHAAEIALPHPETRTLWTVRCTPPAALQ